MTRSSLANCSKFAKNEAMLVVADGGATKIDWAWAAESGAMVSCPTPGFNPTYHSVAQQDALRSELQHLPFDEGKSVIYYYGAGCRMPEAKEVTRAFLQAVWPQAELKILDDLLGAARATCGRQPGIVCILGTGSNSMHYDGQDAADRIPNLGVLLGDEGSGAHIGKELVKAFFYREMPQHLSKLLEPALPGGRDAFLKELYSLQSPGSFLASFVRLVAGQKEDPWVRNLVKACFEAFVERHVLKYAQARALPVHFCGSIAWHFQVVLEEVLMKYQLQKGKILRKPIEELFKFHLNAASSQPFSTDR